MTGTIQRFEPNHRAPVSQATAIEQSRAVAEVQAAVIVAQNVPRDIQRAIAEMRETCGYLAMAEQAFYQVPNRGTGPSVHLMRELARIWGNIEHGSHELRREDDAGVSEVQAFAWDKQTNTRTSRTFIAPHERMKGGGRQRLTDLGDIQNNNNNVAARAVRECISNVLPRWFTEEAQDICRQTLEHGEGEPLPTRIEKMINTFKGIGVTERQIEARLDKKRGQFDAGDVAQMGIVYTSITRDGLSKDEAFPPIEETVDDIANGDEPAKGRSKLSGKVKTAAGDPGRGETEREVVAATVAADQAEGNTTTAPAEPPGAPTKSTPGQTERVAEALGTARKSKARDAYVDLIAGCLREAGYETLDILPAIATHVLKIRITYAATLTDSQLKTVHNALKAWQQADMLGGTIANIIETTDIESEQPPAEPNEESEGKPEAPPGSARRKWLNRMFQLLNEADCSDRDEQLIVIIAAAHAAGIPDLQLEHRDALTDEQLRAVVTQLNKWEKAGELGDQIREAINIHDLRAEGAGEQQTIDTQTD
ncbi:hypothetical protein BMG05_15020 [Mycobacterium malmoense]|nr:hypothetical protein BMG05_15020 [Mycobacterium malmoense]